jgi:hypothetical protein
MDRPLVTDKSVFCIQFARLKGQDSLPEIVMSHHPSVENANEYGIEKDLSNPSLIKDLDAFHPVKAEIKTHHLKLRDVIEFLKTCDPEYNKMLNNCQTLAGKLYAKFANITKAQIVREQTRAYQKLGCSELSDGSTVVTCNLF